MDKDKLNPKEPKPDKEAIVLEMDAVVEVSNKEYLIFNINTKLGNAPFADCEIVQILSELILRRKAGSY